MALSWIELDLRVTWVHFRDLTWKTYDLKVATFYFQNMTRLEIFATSSHDLSPYICE